VIAWRGAGIPVAVVAALIVLYPLRVSAQWWSRAPADFEDCAAAAEQSPSKEAKIKALAECNAKFAGRRKPGGGYTYYDFMQDRSFDIAGPNPTVDERTRIYSNYLRFAELQRRETALAEVEQLAVEEPQVGTSIDVRNPPRKPSKSDRCMIKGSLSCTWMKFTSTVRNAFASNAKQDVPANPR